MDMDPSCCAGYGSILLIWKKTAVHTMLIMDMDPSNTVLHKAQESQGHVHVTMQA